MLDHWSAPAWMVPVSDESREWWVLGSQDDPNAALGRRHVEIIETIDTLTAGRLAVYRRWIVDPDGKAFGKKRLLVAQHRSVMRHVRMHKMGLSEQEASDA